MAVDVVAPPRTLEHDEGFVPGVDAVVEGGDLARPRLGGGNGHHGVVIVEDGPRRRRVVAPVVRLQCLPHRRCRPVDVEAEAPVRHDQRDLGAGVGQARQLVEPADHVRDVLDHVTGDDPVVRRPGAARLGKADESVLALEPEVQLRDVVDVHGLVAAVVGPQLLPLRHVDVRHVRVGADRDGSVEGADLEAVADGEVDQAGQRCLSTAHPREATHHVDLPVLTSDDG